MKKLLKDIKYDLKLNYYNKSVFVVFLIMLFSFLMANYNMIVTFESNRKIYYLTFSEMEEIGENTEELLQKQATITEEVTKGGTLQQYTDNPLRYDYDNMVNSYQYLQGRNLFVGLLKNSTLIYIGLVAGIYMIYLVTYELAENTIKTRLLLDKPQRLLLSKLLSGILIITVLYMTTLLSSWGISTMWVRPVLETADPKMETGLFGFHQILGAIGISYVITIVFCFIGFAIGLLLRKMSISILAFLLLHLVIPSVGKYDYKNLILTIFSHGFRLDEGQRINYIDGVGLISSLLILMLYITVIFAGSCIAYNISKKRGGYT